MNAHFGVKIASTCVRLQTVDPASVPASATLSELLLQPATTTDRVIEAMLAIMKREQKFEKPIVRRMTPPEKGLFN